METDPVNEVRRIRRQISRECSDDPQKVFEYYLKHQRESKRTGWHRFVNTPLERVRATQTTEQAKEHESE
jgi:hypothetical protein